MKDYVRDSFGNKGGKVVLVVFFVLLIALSVGGAVYVFNGNKLFEDNQSVVRTTNDNNTFGTYVFTLQDKKITMKSGDIGSLRFKADDNKAKDAIEWSSSDRDTVFVDPEGRVFALKKGKATITATAGYYSSSCEITVKKSKKQEGWGYSTAYTSNKAVLEKNKNSYSDSNLYSIDVNRKKNCVTVYTYNKNGKYNVAVRSMVCSCGQGDATPTGTFSIYTKTRWQPLFGNVYGQYVTGFNGDILFHSVPYEEYENPDSVEVKDYNGLGKSISMGCVRLAVADAKWIYDNCPEGTTVRVYEDDIDGPLGTPPSMKINTKKSTSWDPTDDDKRNPYYKKQPAFKGVEDSAIDEGEQFDEMKGIKAEDTAGNDITEKVKVKGSVNTDKPGEYLLRYSVKDDMGRSILKDRIITVKES